MWVLRQLRRKVDASVVPFVDWARFCEAPSGLFLWEAFVSGRGKVGTHAGDAEAAVRAFERSLPDAAAANAIKEDSVYSLIGAALLRAEWVTDPAWLFRPCIVVRA